MGCQGVAAPPHHGTAVSQGVRCPLESHHCPNSRRKRLGIWKPIRKADHTTSVPNAWAQTISRTNPRMRETSVSTLISLADCRTFDIGPENIDRTGTQRTRVPAKTTLGPASVTDGHAAPALSRPRPYHVLYSRVLGPTELNGMINTAPIERWQPDCDPFRGGR